MRYAEYAIIIFLLSVSGYAVHADFIDYMGVRLETDRPNVCIFEAEEPEIEFNERALLGTTIKAVTDWQVALNEYTDSDNWDIGLHYILNKTHFDKNVRDFPQCDVLILFDIQPDDEETYLGTTSPRFNNSTHKFMIITVYTETPKHTLYLDLGNMTAGETRTFTVNPELQHEHIKSSIIGQIVKHEFGHALGLGHFNEGLNSTNYSMMRPTISGTVFDPTFDITKHDLDALIHLYGEDGFKCCYYTPRPDPYQIP